MSASNIDFTSWSNKDFSLTKESPESSKGGALEKSVSEPNEILTSWSNKDFSLTRENSESEKGGANERSDVSESNKILTGDITKSNKGGIIDLSGATDPAESDKLLVDDMRDQYKGDVNDYSGAIDSLESNKQKSEPNRGSIDDYSGATDSTESNKQLTELEKLHMTSSEVPNSKQSSGLIGNNLSTPVQSRLCQKPRSVKRMLVVSPSTPVGLARKLLFREHIGGIPQITSNDDVEMVDVEPDMCGDTVGESTPPGYSQEANMNNNSPRRIIKGLRRRHTGDYSSSSFRGSSPHLQRPNMLNSFRDITEHVGRMALTGDDHSEQQVERVATKKTFESQGSNINKIRDKAKYKKVLKVLDKKAKSSKKFENKRKVDLKPPKNQRLIHDYLLPTSTDNNRVITGEATGSCQDRASGEKN